VALDIALDQSAEPLGADARRCDLRFHVADKKVGNADVVAQQLPYGVVAGHLGRKP
jgi:hypothetical protein